MLSSQEEVIAICSSFLKFLSLALDAFRHGPAKPAGSGKQDSFE